MDSALGALAAIFFGSLWLSVTSTLAPSGSNLLSQAFTGSLWLLLDHSLSLSGSLSLSVTPTLVLTGSHCHSLANSGPLWLLGPLLGSQRRCHADTLSPALWCYMVAGYM